MIYYTFSSVWLTSSFLWVTKMCKISNFTFFLKQNFNLLGMAPSIYFKSSMDLGMVIGLDGSLSESVVDVVFSHLECRRHLATTFPPLSFSFVFSADVLKICWVCWVTALCYNRQKVCCCWVRVVMNEDLTRLTLVCGGWVADVKQLSAAEFLGKVMSHTGKIITDGQMYTLSAGFPFAHHLFLIIWKT